MERPNALGRRSRSRQPSRAELHQVDQRAREDRRLDEEHEPRRLGKRLAHLAESAAIGERVVDEDHRRIASQERQQRLEILCLTDDLDPRLIKEVAHAAAEDRMRVREDSSMLGHSGVNGTSSGGRHVVRLCADHSD